ncbi:MAG: hypothetical protein LW860_11040 [Xanthomonadaceae bacterium]|jgi:hypothetical protein|nr:hypothetical protein [Xanthomonadaceae bacterium]
MSKTKAVVIHLAISAAVLAAVAALVMLVWFPHPYGELTGAPRLFLILLCVDLAIGPLLTGIVFKPGKKGLKFDLTVIGLLQAAALTYGLIVAADARPAYVVALKDQFVVVPAKRILAEDLAKAKAPFDRLPWDGPRLVATRAPEDAASRNALLESAFKGRDIDTFPQYYVPFEQEADALVQRAKPVQELIERRPEQADRLRAGMAERGLDLASARYLPIDSMNASMIVVFRKDEVQPAGIIAVEGW